MIERILVVEDDPDVADLLSQALSDLAARVDCAKDGNSAVKMASAAKYSLATVDLIVPGLGGPQLCAALRAAAPVQALLAVTGRFDLIAPLLGTSQGVDDYVLKPFGTEDVREKCRRLLDRGERAAGPAVSQARTALPGCISMQGLSPWEIDVLRFLSRAPGILFSRDEIIAGTWGIHCSLPARAVEIDCDRLRRKLACACGAGGPLTTSGDGRYGISACREGERAWPAR